MSTTKDSYIELSLPKEYVTEGSSEPVWVHNTLKFDMVKGLGAIRYVEGAKYPVKGIPIPEAIHSVNIIKTLTKEWAKLLPFFIFANKDKVLTAFNNICGRTLMDRVVKHTAVPHDYLCPAAFGVYSVVSNFLVNIGVNEHIAERTGYFIAHIFEHDDAWRYRLQDVATEAKLDALFDNPRKELKRLVELFCTRQNAASSTVVEVNVISIRVRALITVVGYVLLIPKYKRAFLSTLRHIKMMEYDECDWYWVCLRDDYNYGGKKIEERLKEVSVIPKRYLIVDGKMVSEA